MSASQSSLPERHSVQKCMLNLESGRRDCFSLNYVHTLHVCIWVLRNETVVSSTSSAKSNNGHCISTRMKCKMCILGDEAIWRTRPHCQVQNPKLYTKHAWDICILGDETTTADGTEIGRNTGFYIRVLLLIILHKIAQFINKVKFILFK